MHEEVHIESHAQEDIDDEAPTKYILLQCVTEMIITHAEFTVDEPAPPALPAVAGALRLAAGGIAGAIAGVAASAAATALAAPPPSGDLVPYNVYTNPIATMHLTQMMNLQEAEFTRYAGWNYNVFASFDDAPPRTNWWGVAGAVLGGIVIGVAVGFLIVGTGGLAAAVVFGVLAGGVSMYAGINAAMDGAGFFESFTVAMRTGLPFVATAMFVPALFLKYGILGGAFTTGLVFRGTDYIAGASIGEESSVVGFVQHVGDPRAIATDLLLEVYCGSTEESRPDFCVGGVAAHGAYCFGKQCEHLAFADAASILSESVDAHEQVGEKEEA